MPGTLGNYLRVAFYRRTLQYCDPTATICFGALLSKPGAEIHKHVYIGPRCMLGLVTLEQDVLLGPAVQIPSGPNIHGIDELATPIRVQPGRIARITVGTNSWIGANSIVLADVQEQTVVGAASVVTKTWPSRTIIAGNPARVIRDRCDAKDKPTSAEHHQKIVLQQPALNPVPSTAKSDKIVRES